MCLGKAFFSTQAGETLLVEHVASVEVEYDQVIITTLLGERKYVEAEIQSVDFSKSRILLRTKSN